MVNSRDASELEAILESLLAKEVESPWLEFKVNNANPERIAQYISGISNSSAISGRGTGYMIWGIEDGTFEVVGTNFSPHKTKHKNQALVHWLSSVIPNVHFEFQEISFRGKKVVMLLVSPPLSRPAEYMNIPYIRVSSSLKQLKKHPKLESKLWNILNNSSFEKSLALEQLSYGEVNSLLHLPSFYNKINFVPDDPKDQLLLLERSKLIKSRDDGKLDITNLGALLLAKQLDDFPTVEHKAIRVVQYSGTDRSEVSKRQDGSKGYAVGFAGLLTWLRTVLPSRETYNLSGERVQEMIFSNILLRELVANALVHQDLILGGSPKIEIFSDRIEFSNPGEPLIDIHQLINHPPLSRNPDLVKTMRLLKLSEDHGTGWDRIALETELAGLPSPRVQAQDSATRVTVLGPRKLTTMGLEDKLQSVYFHSCLLWASSERMTNSSLRKRFGISKNNSAQVTRLLNDAIDHGLIRIYDESASNKFRSYVPYWAG